MIKTKNNQSNKWTALSAALITYLLLAEIISDKMIASSTIPSSIDGPVSGLISLSAVGSIVAFILAISKTKSWQRLVPIIGIIIAVVMFAISFFAFGFSGYGSPQ